MCKSDTISGVSLVTSNGNMSLTLRAGPTLSPTPRGQHQQLSASDSATRGSPSLRYLATCRWHRSSPARSQSDPSGHGIPRSWDWLDAAPSIWPAKNACKAVVILVRDGIELMIVAAGAADREAEEGFANGVHLVARRSAPERTGHKACLY